MDKVVEITRWNIYECLEFLARAISTIPHIDLSFMRTSLRGVPLFIVRHKDKYYSVCYFLQYKNFKVYTNPKPYCKMGTEQTSVRIKTGKEVYRYFKELGEKDEG